MYTALMNDGNYQTINASTDSRAMAYAFLNWSSDEAENLEIEIIDAYGETVATYTDWREKTLLDYDE